MLAVGKELRPAVGRLSLLLAHRGDADRRAARHRHGIEAIIQERRERDGVPGPGAAAPIGRIADDPRLAGAEPDLELAGCEEADALAVGRPRKGHSAPSVPASSVGVRLSSGRTHTREVPFSVVSHEREQPAVGEMLGR